MTTYMVLLPGDEDTWEAAPPEHREAVYATHEQFSKALAERGHRVTGGAELTHSRETRQVRHVAGAVEVTEGPYAETAEQLTGFYLVETDDLDDLLQCVGILTASAEHVVEVRATAEGPS
jgi:hypothetical protein